MKEMKSEVQSMGRYFNTEVCCYPDEHYVGNLDSWLKEIKSMIQSKDKTIIEAAVWGIERITD